MTKRDLILGSKAEKKREDSHSLNDWVGNIDAGRFAMFLIDCTGKILQHNTLAKRMNLKNGKEITNFVNLFNDKDAELINDYLDILSKHNTQLIASLSSYDVKFESFWNEGHSLIKVSLYKLEISPEKCYDYDILRQVLDTETDIFLLLDLDGKILDCNTSFLLAFEVSKNDAVGHDVFSFFPESVRPKRQKMFKKAINEMSVVTMEDERNGRYLESVIIPITGEKLLVEKVIVKTRDITGRKTLEKENRNKEKMFRSIFEAIGDAQIIYNLDEKRTIFCNKSAQNSLGFSKKEFTKIDYSDFDTNTTHFQFKKICDHAFKTGSSSFETVFLRKDGRLFDARVEIRPWEMHKSKFLLITWSDITIFNQTKNAIETAEERLRLAMDIASVGLWDWNMKDDDLYWSDEIYKIVGVEKNKKNIIKDWRRIIHPDDFQRTLRLAIRAGRTGSSFQLEIRYIRQNDNSVRSVRIFGRYYLGDDNKPYRMIGTVQDVSSEKRKETRMKKLIEDLQFYNETVLNQVDELNDKNRLLSIREEQLLGLNKNKDKFFSIIAHDLKSPISGFINLTEMISRDFNQLSLAEMREMAYSLHKSSENIGKLLENLLDWARINRGAMEYQPNNYNLMNYVDEAINQHSISARQKQILIKNAVPDEINVYADVHMIRTVLRNLISNALKFSYRNSEIILAARVNQHDQVELSVTDNGIGMDEKTVKSLFILEEKHSNLGTEDEKGTGLGLIVSEELVKLNGGKIWAEGTPNEGSTFYVALPLGK